MSETENQLTSDGSAPTTWAQGPMPMLTFNSFAHGFSATEITSIIAFSTQPLAMLVMPPSVAKTFAKQLLELVEAYEKQTGITVSTIPEINAEIASRRAGNVP